MELFRTIYPYTVYILYASALIALITMFVLLIKTLGALKALKLTLAPVNSITTHINEVTEKKDYITKYFRDKNNELKQFLKKFGLFLTVWHILFPKKDKRRR